MGVTAPDVDAGRRYYSGVSQTRTTRYWGFALAAALCFGAPPTLGAQAANTGPPTILGGAPLDPRWGLALDAAPLVAPAFDDTTAFIVTRPGRIVAVDLATGVVRWTRESETRVQPATGDGLVFVAAAGRLDALDPATGLTRWTRALEGAVAAPLYWDTGWLLVSQADGTLLAYRAADGELLWAQALGAPLGARPAPALDRLYLPLDDGRVVAADLATGRTIWTLTVEGTPTGLLALGRDLFVGTSARAVVSVDLQRGRQRWRWRLGAAVLGAPAGDDRHVYLVTLDNVVRALDRGNGHLRWRQGLPSRPAGEPVIVGRHVLVPMLSTEMRAFDARTGRQAFILTAAGEAGATPHLRPSPRATGAWLFTLTIDGRLQGFGPRIEPPPAPLEALPGTPVAGEAPPPSPQPPAG